MRYLCNLKNELTAGKRRHPQSRNLPNPQEDNPISNEREMQRQVWNS